MNIRKKHIVCLFLLIVVNTVFAQSGKDSTSTDKLPFMQRFSFHTNMLDWVTTTANIGIELDLSGTPENRFSVLLTGKYNGNTLHTVHPRYLYNLASATIEGRKYWRTGGIDGTPFPRYGDTPRDSSVSRIKWFFHKNNRDTTVSAARWFFMRIRRNLISGRTYEKPRYWRAYYLGIYAGYDQFTYRLSRIGKQGQGVNFGFTGGWSVPLYAFRQGGYLDLDLGLALGTKLVRYDRFGYEEETGCYTVEPGARSWHIAPYPVVHDIHVSLVYRFRTIGDKVQGGPKRYEEYDARMTEERNKRFKQMIDENYMRQQMEDSIRQVRAKEKAEKLKQKELKAKEKAEKEKQKKEKKNASSEKDGNEAVKSEDKKTEEVKEGENAKETDSDKKSRKKKRKEKDKDKKQTSE